MELKESDFVGKWLGMSAHKMSLLFTKILHVNGYTLTHEQMVLLKSISCSEGISQKELAIKLDRDKTSIARSINTLEKNHKVVRINTGDDKRINNLYLTKEGHQLLEEIHPIFINLTQEVLADFPEEEITQLKSTLSKLIHTLNTIEIRLHTQQ